MKPVDPWTLRTKVCFLYDAHQRSHALQREVREVRARLRALTPRPGPALPHPDARGHGRRERPGARDTTGAARDEAGDKKPTEDRTQA